MEQTFSQKLNRLEDIVKQLESPEVELEQGLKLLEEGVNLHKQCQAILTESQAKITVLLKADQSSNADPSVDDRQTQASTPEVDPNQNELPF